MGDLETMYDIGTHSDGIHNKRIKLDNADEMFNIGCLYLKKCSFYDENYEKAINLFEKASKLGDPNSIFKLGVLAYNGAYKCKGIDTIDFYIKSCERAAETGHYLAFKNLEILYEEKRHNYNDSKKYVELSEKFYTTLHHI